VLGAFSFSKFMQHSLPSQHNVFSADTGFAGVSVTPAQFPALHTLGMSFARADLCAAGGVNPPHYHPRATETALVLAGRVYAGFVDSGGRIFAKVLEMFSVCVWFTFV
jgi:hypothetical protein